MPNRAPFLRGCWAKASDLTLVECDRVLIRAVSLNHIAEADAVDRRSYLNAAATHWNVLRVGADVVERARQRFPGEPIRTLDALHLASALFARAAVPGLDLLSLDSRIRSVAGQLGFTLQPAIEAG
jgi:predicted nucleic acid-binding protein